MWTLRLPDGSFRDWLLSPVLQKQSQLKTQLHAVEVNLMTSVTELVTQVTSVSVQLGKAKTEIVTRIQALEDALANVTAPAGSRRRADRFGRRRSSAGRHYAGCPSRRAPRRVIGH